MKIKPVFLTLLIIALNLSAEVKTNLKNFISSECNTLIGIDMKGILSIPAFSTILNSSGNKELNQLDDLGLRPQDINSVVIGLNTEKLASDPMSFEKQPELISISTVKDGITFDKLINAAKEKKVKTEVKTVSGVRTVDLHKDGKVFVMAEITPKVIAVGSKGMIAKAIALKAGQESGSVLENKELTKLADSQTDLFWVVGSKPQAKPADPNQPLDNPMTGLFGDLKLFSISLAYQEDVVKVNSDLICKTEAGAASMAMTGQLMTGLLSASEDSPVKAEQIKFTKDKSTLNVKINIPAAALLKTLAAAKGLAE